MAAPKGKDITAKIVALILAMALWGYVTNSQNPPVEATINVPLEVRNLAENHIVADVPEAVRIRVRGPRAIVAALQTQDFRAFLDLKGVTEGQQTVRVRALAPVGLELLDVSPAQAQIRVDFTASRTLPVEVRVLGTLAEGLAVAKTTATPLQVTVKGPRAQLDEIDKAVAIIDLNGKNADFTLPVTPVLIGRDGQALADGATMVPEKVNIAVNLTQGVAKKTIDVKTIIYGELSPGIVLKGITTKPSKIQITGDAKALERLESVYTEPISIAGVDKEVSREVRLQLPEGILAAQNTVTVQISVGSGR